MKSAWELALERSGGALRELSPEKKEKIAELERAAQAKIAAAKITAEHKLATMTDPDEIDQLKDSRVDEKYQRVVVAEAFVYFPNKPKRDVLKKLEAALYTLRLPDELDLEKFNYDLDEIIITPED